MPNESAADIQLICLAETGAPTKPVHAWRPGGLAAALGALPPDQAAFLRAAGFTAAPGQLMLLPGGQDGVAGAALGLGQDRSPWTHGALPLALPPGDWHLVPGDYDPAQAALGFCLGAYQFQAFKSATRAPARLAGVPDAVACMARSIWLARDLINTPANRLGPVELSDTALRLAARFGAQARRIDGPALGREYPTVAAVGAGSDRPPSVVRFAWRGSTAGDGAPLIWLCGKGVCFDSGGYDLKPPAGMLRMKKDMGGAALLLGLAALLMEQDAPLRLEVSIGCVENMVSGRAFRPMDVLQTRKGLTVEVGNTDAEGRLVLCDLLAEASGAAPDLLIDAATLTGAARVALGPDLPALFCPDDETAARLLYAGVAAHDPVWRLPLWDGYDPWLASPVADLNNVSSKPMAGSIVAALFLQRFIEPGVRWIHLDTYAWNDTTRAGRPEGGEALGLRALHRMIQSLLEVHIVSGGNQG